MIIPEIPADLKRWDAYEAFHWGCSPSGVSSTHNAYSSPCVIFDTQEVILTQISHAVEYRRFYSVLNIHVIGTADSRLSGFDFFPPTEDEDDSSDAIPRAWLNIGGHQIVLVDPDTRIAVGLSGTLELKTTMIPRRFHRWAKGYFPGPGQRPIGCPIKISRPAGAVLDKDELAHCEEIMHALRMEIELTGDRPKPRSFPTAGLDPQKLLKVKLAKDLSPDERAALYYKGIGRVVTHYPYLHVVP